MRRHGPEHGHTVTFPWRTSEGIELEVTAEYDAGDPSCGLSPAWFLTSHRASNTVSDRDFFRALYGGNELEHVEQYAGDLAEGIAEDMRAETRQDEEWDGLEPDAPEEVES